MSPFNETLAQKSARLNRESRWAWIMLGLLILLMVGCGIAGLARAWVWIKWAIA